MLGLSYSNHVKSTSFLNVVPVLERSGGFLHLATVGFLHLGNQGTCSNHEPRRGNRVYDTSVLPCVLVWCSGRWGGFLVGKNRMDQVWSLLGVFFFCLDSWWFPIERTCEKVVDLFDFDFYLVVLGLETQGIVREPPNFETSSNCQSIFELKISGTLPFFALNKSGFLQQQIDQKHWF